MTVPATQTPGLTLVKTADRQSVSAAGETITYTVTATNTGTVSLSDVAITDPLPNLSELSCTPAQPAILAPGDELACTATYVVTQLDLGAGAVTNTAGATGTPPTGPPLTPSSSLTVVANPPTSAPANNTPPLPVAGAPFPPTSPLAFTGLSGWILPIGVIAVLLIGAGAAMMLIGKRRTRRDLR